MSVEDTDEKLIAKFVNGDEFAFNTLYKKYGIIIANIILHYVGNEIDMEEILSQTFFAFSKEAKKNGNKIENAEAFLRVIATRKCNDHLRAKYKASNKLTNVYINDLKENDNKLLSGQDIAAEFQIKNQIQRARMLIEQLSPKYREVAVMYFMEQIGQQEISEHLKIDYDVVRTRIHRIRKYLRENL